MSRLFDMLDALDDGQDDCEPVARNIRNLTVGDVRYLKSLVAADVGNNSAIKLVQTCGACPEQYDAFLNDKQVGYLRMRHGSFRVDCPDCGGETVYTGSPEGDGLFEDRERLFYLNAAKSAIMKWVKRQDPSDG